MTSPLERLTGLDVAGFAPCWGVEPLLRRRAELPGGLDELFGPDALDELVSRRGLRTPFLRVARSGSDIPERSWTRGGGTGAATTDLVSDDDLLGLLADGATLIGQGLHRTWPPLVDFVQALMAQLGHPVQANSYLTPPQNRGFDAHFDVHDVFVAQVSGRKRWLVHRPVVDIPLRSQEWREHREATAARAEQEPVLDIVLETGDCLYLPRGWVHSAQALGEVSTHITFGVHPWTRTHVAEDLVAEALAALADDVSLRAALPLGRGPLPVDAVRTALLAAIERVPDSVLETRFERRERQAVRTSPVRPVAQVQAALDLTADTPVRWRPHLRATVTAQGQGCVVESRLGRHVASGSANVVEGLVAGDVVSARDLGVEAARALLRAGVVVPA